jgi:hypothetical protein
MRALTLVLKASSSSLASSRAQTWPSTPSFSLCLNVQTRPVLYNAIDFRYEDRYLNDDDRNQLASHDFVVDGL